MNYEAVLALVRRYVFLYTRSKIRLVELIFWPIVDLMVWGYLTVYLQQQGTGGLPRFITFLIGAMILWDVLFRAQQGVALSFLEDVWTRNVINVFVAPVRTVEYVVATYLVGCLRIALTFSVLSLLALTMYEFSIFSLGIALAPFFANLLLFGWALGMISTALIVRWGPAAESLAWAVPFIIQPFAAVFYPVDVLPPLLQVLARWLPCTHIFEGMRSVLAGHPMPLDNLLWAIGLNASWLAIAGWTFVHMLKVARLRGFLNKFVVA